MRNHNTPGVALCCGAPLQASNPDHPRLARVGPGNSQSLCQGVCSRARLDSDSTRLDSDPAAGGVVVMLERRVSHRSRVALPLPISGAGKRARARSGRSQPLPRPWNGCLLACVLAYVGAGRLFLQYELFLVFLLLRALSGG
ncbi:uncharacterized protein K452DRAFT_77533 [Aplosporella prunicola CBS 121167]|uniref:Uncharacterized protein n=1 Tax=Aplosporella prunicola CBS 121167 TaxID=1176127 RepID=A0A6A6B983_9PEZI|nr:uncharacterized protein K452DRAFT_77533 [Aplosporella prunicola CBS 121167]KAF2139447.1 hypothetical protein K452DRAFT_77533 [Aplosporella prunicola CBS 121167]